MNKRSSFVIMHKLISILGNLKYIIILAVIGGYIGNMCAIGVMGFGALAIYKLIDPSLNISLNLIITLLLIFGILRGLLRFVEQYNNHFIAFKLLASLRDKIFTCLRKLCPAKLETKQKGNIISMLTSDVETLEVFYAHTISPIMIAILVDGTIFVLVTIFSNIYLGLISLLSYLIIGVIIPFTSDKLLKKDGEIYRNEFASTSSYFLDSIRGINDIILNNNQTEREKYINDKSKILNEKTKNIKIKSSYVSSISNFVVSLTILLTLIIGILSVIYLSLPLGKMIVCLVLIFSSFGPVLSLASLPSNLTQTFASGNRILDLLEEKPMVNENNNGIDFNFDNLKINNVSFAYNNNLVIKDVNLEINKGDIVGLVGESGCGKSTLLKLLLRFYDVNQGEILYNNINIKDTNNNSLHNNVTLVSQDTYLFNDTILNNLKFVNPNASIEDVKEACKKASINDFIESLDNGYDTEVGLLGDKLSAGEKQRIGLARAFLSGANVILLDEVTSNVDAINEGIILNSLKNISQEKTIVLVSHRESTISICSKIYKMKDGILYEE